MKRSNDDLIKQIFDVLESEKHVSMHVLSKKIKAHFNTTKQLVERIMKMQEKPKIRVLEISGHSYLYIEKKEEKKVESNEK